jgi:hypothetical protein
MTQNSTLVASSLHHDGVVGLDQGDAVGDALGPGSFKLVYSLVCSAMRTGHLQGHHRQ